jgi:HK97 family phage major capsid protein
MSKNERAIYSPTSEHSFFADLAKASHNDDVARARLETHQEQRARQWKKLPRELRTNPNTTSGLMGEFAPPLWAIDQFATVARAGRVLADLIPNLRLPSGVSSVHVPAITAGGDVAIQPQQGAAVASVDDTTADRSSNVVTIAGETDASIQLFEQTPQPPGFDGVVYTDLVRAYNQQLEKQLIAGTGANGQLTGVINVTGRNADISGSGTTTLTALWPLLGQSLASVGNARLQPAECFLLAPRRWSWISAALDTQNRPFSLPNHGGPVDTATIAPAGRLLSKPAYESGGIVAGTTADPIIAIRPSDLLLWESTPRFDVIPNALSGTLQVRLRLRVYVALSVLRPSAVTVITSLPQPSNY